MSGGTKKETIAFPCEVFVTDEKSPLQRLLDSSLSSDYLLDYLVTLVIVVMNW